MTKTAVSNPIWVVLSNPDLSFVKFLKMLMECYGEVIGRYMACESMWHFVKCVIFIVIVR
jgi:hypothetical protein